MDFQKPTRLILIYKSQYTTLKKMKFWSLIVLVGFVMSFSGCKKEPQEGARNTFTWKGVMYDGYSDVPLANTQVYLEAEKYGIPDASYDAVAEGETDMNGNFTLTYKRIRGNYTALRLYTLDARYNDFPVYVGNINTDLEKDLATIPHVRIIFQPNLLEDSLIVVPDNMVESNRLRYDENLNAISNGKLLVLESKKDPEAFIKCAFLPTSATTGEHALIINYVHSAQELRKAIDSNNGYMSRRFDLKGFPYTDTIQMDF